MKMLVTIMPLPQDTNRTFIKKAINKWGNRYDYTLVQYVNSRTPIVIICNKHKQGFEQTPKAHFAAKHHCCPLCYQEVAGSYQNEWRLQYKSESISPDLSKFSTIVVSIFCA